jgi:hypothetical protein
LYKPHELQDRCLPSGRVIDCVCSFVKNPAIIQSSKLVYPLQLYENKISI